MAHTSQLLGVRGSQGYTETMSQIYICKRFGKALKTNKKITTTKPGTSYVILASLELCLPPKYWNYKTYTAKPGIQWQSLGSGSRRMRHSY